MMYNINSNKINHLQLKASNPSFSTWVSASAGTGKTKILTDRVLRLLLKGVDFHKILCLTFTNAAAGEMQERINKNLSKWSALNHTDLVSNLSNILGEEPTEAEITNARNCYSNLLKSQERITIHTIHAFCQKVLKQFPMEARLSPSFQIMSDIQYLQILKQLKHDILSDTSINEINEYSANALEVARKRSGTFAERSNLREHKCIPNFDVANPSAFAEYLIKNFHEMTIAEIIQEIIDNRVKLSPYLETSYMQDISKDYESLYKQIVSAPFMSEFIIPHSSASEIKSFFLTNLGEKRKKLISSKQAAASPQVALTLEVMQDEVYSLSQREKTDELLAYSAIFSHIAKNAIEKYEEYKNSLGLLDYSDLIIRTKNLLTNQEAKDWVLYKLDGGVEHLLVDEAQDTSKEQWKIIEMLISEFYAGDTSRSENRTIFVVGDDKQSIFSFQGADLDSFTSMNQLLLERLTSSNKTFNTISLDISYRSSAPITDLAHKVFAKIKERDPQLFLADNPRIMPFRSKHKGKVELWPLVTAPEEEVFWPVNSLGTASSNKIKLARQIAEYIKKKINSKTILPSTGLPVRAQDFLILVRKRDDFTLEVIKQIKNLGLDIMGIDRLTLSKSLIIMDLLSAARFVINPLNDLNLASLLKSPIIGISENELQELCISRGEKFLWEYLSQIQHSCYNRLASLYNLAKVSDAGNFFHLLCSQFGCRTLLLSHFGQDHNETIDELFYLAEEYTNKVDRSLFGFIEWFDTAEVNIKRDGESSAKIRIMTAHASKGLQAPIVILCDTTSIPVNNERFLLDEENGNMLTARSTKDAPEYYKELKSKQYKNILAEYTRLLYVALTRAEDELIICGYQGQTKIQENCWYQLVKDAMEDMTHPSEDGTISLHYGGDEIKLTETDDKDTSKIEYFWSQNRAIASLNSPTLELLENRKRRIPSPLYAKHSADYGIMFHKIMEDAIKAGSLDKIKDHPIIDTLSTKMQARVKANVKKILLNDDLRNLLKNECKTEITIGLQNNGNIKIFRIDLLVLGEKDVTIVDYKSDQNVDKDVPEQYLDQLRSYKKAVKEVYPHYGHNVYCKILWLESGELIDVNI